eukprot:Hpha_TRINITY_DN14319_c0_g1::TRINITY_DN14319_c0_g1_i3::g.87017::m.87017
MWHWSTGWRCLNASDYVAGEQSEASRGWNYLACTTVMHPIGANNATDMFPPENYSVSDMRRWCEDFFDAPLAPRPRDLPHRGGLYRVSRLAGRLNRTLLSYGTLDPWARLGLAGGGGSVVQEVSGGSHCSDVAEADGSDTDAMRAARAEQRRILGEWLSGKKDKQRPRGN